MQNIVKTNLEKQRKKLQTIRDELQKGIDNYEAPQPGQST